MWEGLNRIRPRLASPPPRRYPRRARRLLPFATPPRHAGVRVMLAASAPLHASAWRATTYCVCLGYHTSETVRRRETR